MKRICDKCDNYYESPCGSTESCFAPRRGSMVIENPNRSYIEERMNGNKTTCKSFEKIPCHAKQTSSH